MGRHDASRGSAVYHEDGEEDEGAKLCEERDRASEEEYRRTCRCRHKSRHTQPPFCPPTIFFVAATIRLDDGHGSFQGTSIDVMSKVPL